MALIPTNEEQLAQLQAAADTIKRAADAEQVNALVNGLRVLLGGQNSADCYCALSHVIGMLDRELDNNYTIAVITMLAMQSRMRIAPESMH